MPAGGNCPTHKLISAREIIALKRKHPNAKVLAHPECTREVRRRADFIASTSGMVKIARENPAEEFIVATESGLVYRLRKENPGKKFYPVYVACPNMKKNTLEKVRDALVSEKNEVFVREEIAEKVRGKIAAMLA
jgi:quinolinate synthase